MRASLLQGYKVMVDWMLAVVRIGFQVSNASLETFI
jgi:hypothetical protein